MKPWTESEQARILRAAERIELVYHRAVRAGDGVPGFGEWYDEQHRELERIGALESVPYGAATLAAVALAPRQRWEAVVAAVPAVLRGEAVSGFYGASVRKARECLELLRSGAGPYSALALSMRPETAPKSNAFARALLGDGVAVVVDVWSARVADLPAPTGLRPYRLAEEAYHHAADALRVRPRFLQEVTWVGTRDLGVVLPHLEVDGATRLGSAYGRGGQPLAKAAREVLSRWERGDLAGAVRDLAAALVDGEAA